MHYIRFLKPSAIRQQGTERYLAALLTLTTDLGESFYSEDVALDIILNANDDKIRETLAKCTITWRAGMRALPFEVNIKPELKSMPCFVEVAARDPKLGQVSFVEGSMHLPIIISARTQMINPSRGPAEAEKTVSRTINFGSDDELLIWEEAGDSIARHVWDAGMAVATLFANSQQLRRDLPQIASLLENDRSRSIEIIELGTGTGLAGLALAKAFQRTNVLMTDVAEVKALVNRNIASNKVASGSSIKFQALEWSDQMPPAIIEQHCDLILASDVTYNPDSSGDLVNTIAKIARSSPTVLVLIAMKKRHASEEVFFDLMNEATLSILEKAEICLDQNNVEMKERIELFAFESNER